MAQSLSVSISVLLLNCVLQVLVSYGQDPAPVQLVFRDVLYPNNSVLLLNDIGEFSDYSAILCTTNNRACCAMGGNHFGEWYYPNGSMVPNSAAGYNFYRSRTDNQTIYLNRRNNVQTPTGAFCCKLPDNNDMNHTLCVTLDISTPHPPPAVVSVTATPDDSVIIAGSTLTLTCTIELIEAVDDATVTVNTVWSGPTGTQFTTTTSLATRIANTTYTSRATLSSVGTSDSGEYTCTAKLSSTSPSVIESEEVSGTVVLVAADVACGYSEFIQPNMGQVNFTLRGKVYANNSEILLGCIGYENAALLCLTDNTECCRTLDNTAGVQMGQYFFPNGSEVMSYTTGARGLNRNRGRGTVSLNRVYSPTSSTGVYRCEIPDASGNTQTLYVNIVLKLSSRPMPTAAVQTTSSDPQPSGDCDCNTVGIVAGVTAGLLAVIIMMTVVVGIGVVCVSKRRSPVKHDDKVTVTRPEARNGACAEMVYEEIQDHKILSARPKTVTDNFPLARNVAYLPVLPRENTAAAPQNQPDDELEESDYIEVN